MYWYNREGRFLSLWQFRPNLTYEGCFVRYLFKMYVEYYPQYFFLVPEKSSVVNSLGGQTWGGLCI